MTYLFSNTASIFQSDGSAITTFNPLPVTLGSANITIVGNTNIIDTVKVVNTESTPLFTYANIQEVGTSGDLKVPWLPVSLDGNANVRILGNITGITTLPNVIIGTMPSVTGNVHVYGNVDVDHMPNIGITGNILGITTLPGITVTNFPSNVRITDMPGIHGNVNVDNFPSNVSITQMPAVTGNVHVYGNVAVDQPVTVNQGTNPWVVSGNVQVTNQVTDIIIADSTYEMNIARGLVDSQYAEFKNGYAGSLSQGVEASIWSQNTLYPWASWTTAQRLYVASSSAADTGQTVYIDGLASDYSRQTETITTNGTTAVASAKSYLRINHMYIVDGSPNAGTVTTRIGSASGTIVGGMNIGFARNRQAQFTVPLGWTAYILYGDATQFRGGSGNIGGTVRMYTRTPNNGNPPFMLAFIAEVVNGVYRNDFTIPFAIPQKTDIDIRIVPDGNGTEATCNYQMVMIPN
jgi:hypothetical protein